MGTLVGCSGCGLLVRRGEGRCPHCGVVRPAGTFVRAAGAVALGVALGGCPEDNDGDTAVSVAEPAYGVPVTESNGLPGSGDDAGASDSGSSSDSSTGTGSDDGSGTADDDTSTG